jgi:hypothetical protein
MTITKTMRIGIVCYPTFGGSGVLATELGKALAQKGHQVHFITLSATGKTGFFYTQYILSRGACSNLSIV